MGVRRAKADMVIGWSGRKGSSSWAMADRKTGGEKPEPVQDSSAETGVRRKLRMGEGSK